MLQDDLEKFFQELAVNSHSHSVDDVRNFYFGFVRTIMLDLKKNRKVELPGLGTFYVHDQAPKRVGLRKDQVAGMEKTPIVKFSPFYRVSEHIKAYFSGMRE